jgi:hypothetical protein
VGSSKRPASSRREPRTAFQALRDIRRHPLSGSLSLPDARLVQALEDNAADLEEARLVAGARARTEQAIKGAFKSARLSPYQRRLLPTLQPQLMRRLSPLVIGAVGAAAAELRSREARRARRKLQNIEKKIEQAERRVRNTWTQRRGRHGQDSLQESLEHAELHLLQMCRAFCSEGQPSLNPAQRIEQEVRGLIKELGNSGVAPAFVVALLTELRAIPDTVWPDLPNRESIKKILQRL